MSHNNISKKMYLKLNYFFKGNSLLKNENSLFLKNTVLKSLFCWIKKDNILKNMGNYAVLGHH